LLTAYYPSHDSDQPSTAKGQEFNMLYLILFLVVVIIAQGIIILVLWRRTQRVALGLDEITEDTLKALYHLSREKPTIRISDLVRAADLQPERIVAKGGLALGALHDSDAVIGKPLVPTAVCDGATGAVY
jgi:hypothetical protein